MIRNISHFKIPAVDTTLLLSDKTQEANRACMRFERTKILFLIVFGEMYLVEFLWMGASEAGNAS